MSIRIAFIFSALFFIFGILTLTNYGINWDTINHLPRGQVYLHYLLTGKKDFSDLSPYKNYWQKPDDLLPDASLHSQKGPLRSYYENEAFNFDWFMQTDGNGHPPLSDILSSVFNRVLFGHLRIINDIDSYRVYGIFLAAILVGLVGYWVSNLYGKFAGITSSAILATYPLFWSESHFNTEKDIPETVFWSFFLFSFWKGITSKKAKWILISGLFFGLALGTKFNIIFVLFIIIPWLIAYLFVKFKEFNKKKIFKLGLSFVFALFTAIAIFIVSWPYLWPDTISRVQRVVGFYKGIGLTSNVDPRFLGPLRTNIYPVEWISFTTQPIVLLFFVLGAFYLIYLVAKKKDLNGLFFLLWFAVPIARVSYPGTTIYGGIRQIMEYIPAMAIIAGIGASFMIQNFNSVKFFFVVLIFAFLLYPIVKYYPNENVYFNFLIGGLKGAKEKNIPGWGNSFGASYRQGIAWIDQHAENGANLVFVYELIPNIPRVWLRKDIDFSNGNRSGYLGRGEYAMTLTYWESQNRSYYDNYLEKFLKPVYEVKADGVPILKIWKNDKEHFKEIINEFLESATKLTKTKDYLLFDLGRERRLWRLEIKYHQENCPKLIYGYVEISKNGNKWDRLPGNLPEDWRIPYLKEQPRDGSFIEPLVGQEAQFIRLNLNPENTCLKNVQSFKIFSLQ